MTKFHLTLLHRGNHKGWGEECEALHEAKTTDEPGAKGKPGSIQFVGGGWEERRVTHADGPRYIEISEKTICEEI